MIRKALIKTAVPTLSSASTGLPPAATSAFDSSVTFVGPQATTQAVDQGILTDAFSNPLSNLGVGSSNTLQATQYVRTNLTQDYNTLTTLYRENWVVQNIVQSIPDDMLKGGLDFAGEVTAEQEAKLNTILRKVQFYDKLRNGMYWGRLYGGALGVILIKGHNDLSKPLTPDSVIVDSFGGLLIVDRWNGINPSTKLVTDMMDADFGLPETYEIQLTQNEALDSMTRDKTGPRTHTIHHSRVVRFIGRPLPNQELVNEQFWGTSELESIYEEITRRDNTAANIAALVHKAQLTTQESEDLDQLLALSSNEAQKRFWNVLRAQNLAESNFGVRIIRKGDAIKRDSYNFAGLKDVYDGIKADVAGASHIPVTRLFGVAPSGFNASGESDTANYNSHLDQVRERTLDPVLSKLLPIVQKSVFGKVMPGITYKYPPLKTLSAGEKVDLAKTKVEILDKTYVSGIISQKVYLEEIAAISVDTDLFGSITPEMLKAASDKTKIDVDKEVAEDAAKLNAPPQQGNGGANAGKSIDTQANQMSTLSKAERGGTPENELRRPSDFTRSQQTKDPANKQ